MESRFALKRPREENQYERPEMEEDYGQCTPEEMNRVVELEEEEAIFKRECKEYQSNVVIRQLWFTIRQKKQELNLFYDHQKWMMDNYGWDENYFYQEALKYQQELDQLICQLPLALQSCDSLYF